VHIHPREPPTVVEPRLTPVLKDTPMATVVRRLEVSQKLAAEAYTFAEEHEANLRSILGYMPGLTRLSQRTPWQDGQFALDRAASRLLTTVH
jgi:hypothetical protein